MVNNSSLHCGLDIADHRMSFMVDNDQIVTCSSMACRAMEEAKVRETALNY